MKTIYCLAILSFCLILASCTNDQAANTPKAATVTDASQKTQKATPAPPSRPTENIQVKFPGQQAAAPKPAPSKPVMNPNLSTNAKAPTAAVVERADGMNEEEKRMTRQREAQQAEYDRKNPTATKSNAKPAKVDKDALPNACDLVSAEFISKTLGVVAARDIYVKDGSGKNPTNARSCFFKWDNGSNPNAGVLVQVQKNPLPDEFPDWASYYIRAKRDHGDKMPDGSGSYRYKDFPGIGVAGAYNYELARYAWRTETDNVFLVAFNLQSSEAEQKIWAKKIGDELMRTFAKTKS